MFSWYFSLENSFVSYVYETFVGRDLHVVLDWLDHEKSVPRTHFRTLYWKKNQ